MVEWPPYVCSEFQNFQVALLHVQEMSANIALPWGESRHGEPALIALFYHPDLVFLVMINTYRYKNRTHSCGDLSELKCPQRINF